MSNKKTLNNHCSERQVRMRKEFNITGLCVPKKHYMVNLNSRLEQLKKMVDKGSYFAVNRARQYGKTTMLAALRSEERRVGKECL